MKSSIKSFKVYCLPLTERKVSKLKAMITEYTRIYNFAANFMPSLPEKYLKGNHPSELYTKWIKSDKVERKIHSLDALYAIQDAWANFKASKEHTIIETPNIIKFDNVRYSLIKKNNHYGIIIKSYKEFPEIYLPLITGQWKELIEHLDKILSESKNPGVTTYNLKDNSVSIPVKIPQSKKFLKKDKIETIIGIDRGINNHVVLSAIDKNGKVLSVKLFNGKKDKDKIRRLHKLSDKKKSHSKNIKDKISNYKDTLTDTISKQIVDFITKYKNPIVIWEQLDSFKNKKSEGLKSERKLISRWSYGAIKNKTEYKLKPHGIYSIEVSPYKTSQICHKCGAIGVRDGINFKCEKCGLGVSSNPTCTIGQYNADVNASINIALRGLHALYGREEGNVVEPNVQPNENITNAIPTQMSSIDGIKTRKSENLVDETNSNSSNLRVSGQSMGDSQEPAAHKIVLSPCSYKQVDKNAVRTEFDEKSSTGGVSSKR